VDDESSCTALRQAQQVLADRAAVGRVDQLRERLPRQGFRRTEDRRRGGVRVGDRAVLVEREQALVRLVERAAQNRGEARARRPRLSRR
jgi:hypothetical protein